MVKRKSLSFTIPTLAIAVLANTGCFKTVEQVPPPVVSGITSKSMGTIPATNAEQGIMPKPQIGIIMEEPVAFRTPEKVRVIEVAGYRNEKGEVMLPTRKVVIEQEAGWNMEAVRNPHRAYIAPENVVSAPSLPNSLSATANSATLAEIPQEISAVQLTSMDNIEITGLFRKDQETAAMSLATSDQVAVYDDDLGWVLMPSTKAVPDVIFRQ